MEKIIWLIINVPCSLMFTGLGIYALKSKKPMWFYAGTTVSEDEISDVRAYNRENGIMWIAFSLPLWLSTFLGFWDVAAAGITLGVACTLGLLFLVLNYKRIYKKYKKET